MKVYTLTHKIYLDTINETYTKIIVINKKPVGPLNNLIQTLKNNKLSIFDISPNNGYNICNYAIKHPSKNELLETEDLTDLFEFLIENNYTIDKSISRIYNKNKVLNKDFICIITFED